MPDGTPGRVCLSLAKPPHLLQYFDVGLLILACGLGLGDVEPHLVQHLAGRLALQGVAVLVDRLPNQRVEQSGAERQTAGWMTARVPRTPRASSKEPALL